MNTHLPHMQSQSVCRVSDADSLSPLRHVLQGQHVLAYLANDWQYTEANRCQLVACHAVRFYPARNSEEHADSDLQGVIVYEMCFARDCEDPDCDDVSRQWTQTFYGEYLAHGVEAYAQRVTRRLTKSWRTQLAIGDPQGAVTCIPSLNLVLRLKGLDERIPGLTLLRQPEKIKLQPPTELLSHRLKKRCVLRLNSAALNDQRKSFDESQMCSTVIAKCYKLNSHKGQQTHELMLRLHDYISNSQTTLRIARPLYFSQELNTLIMQGIEASTTDVRHSYSDDLGKMATCVAALHDVPIEPIKPASRPFCVDSEMQLLNDWVRCCNALFPNDTPAFNQAMQFACSDIDEFREVQEHLIHRDLYDKQFIVSGGHCYLLDFDTLCVGDPALDVGNFLAHLYLESIQRGWPEEELAEMMATFLQEYQCARTYPLAKDFDRRVRFYLTTSLMRLACINRFYEIDPQVHHKLLWATTHGVNHART